jgi:signal transduction histidine kinase
MKLRTKAIAIISILGLMVFLALHLCAVFIILPSFENLEKQDNQEAVTAATKALDFSISDLGRRVIDWAKWDDTYYFAQHRNNEYIRDYLMDSAFQTLGIDFFMIIGSNGSIVYCKSVDFQNGVEIPTSSEVQDRFRCNSLIWNFSSPDDLVAGVFLLPNQTFLIASAPILTSVGEGPIMGSLIYGEDISSIQDSHVSEIANLAISIYRADEPETQNDYQFQSLFSNEKTIITKTNGARTISGCVLIKDINSNPAFIMQVDQDRDIYRQGQNVEYLFLASSLSLSILLGFGIMLLLERNVIRPLNKLTGYVKEMPTNPNVPKNPPKFGTDETSLLAYAIKDAMTQKLDTIREMGGMIGHDLRNPLTGIKSAAYYLANSKTKLTETDKAMLKTIDDCVEYSNKIVNDLLDYSGEIRLEPSETNPKKLLEVSLSTISIPGYIKLVDETKTDPQFKVDIGKISRVFNNLIKNAFDALEKGGQLIISSHQINGNVEIEFSDTGTGMTEETMKRLWVPFFTTKAKGMGFGLSICKRIIEAHGGKISVVSNLGKGTVFLVSFPLKRETSG